MNFTSANSPVSIDTNILIYSVDSSDPIKHEIADKIVERLIEVRGCLPLQCLSEFYALTTKKRLLSTEEAERVVQRMLMSLVIVPSETADVVHAMHLHQEHGLQYFDALLLATARRVGCSLFLTEDMQNGRSLNGITISNPLLPAFSLDASIPPPGAR